MGQLRLTAALLAVAVLAVAGCSSSSSTPVDRGGVTVSARLERSGDSYRLLTTFTPDKPGFHVYSISLPDGGVDGIGVPTRIRARSGLDSLGRAQANRPEVPIRLDAIGLEVPAYPDGAVTLTQDVHRASGADPKILVTYGACSASLCLPPVHDQEIAVAS
ncbi:MAG: hypothetical protein ABR598_05435 [Candidatus Dormibacteria bacterium]